MRMRSKHYLPALAFGAALLTLWIYLYRAAVQPNTPLPDVEPVTSTPKMEAVPGYRTTVQTLEQGSGAVVSKGDTVTVHATGIVKESNKKFWSTKDQGQSPFTYQAGVGGVITGWDQGCLGMKVGETRRLDIPAAEGYGAGGFPAWGIPQNAGLIFEITILSIKGK